MHPQPCKLLDLKILLLPRRLSSNVGYSPGRDGGFASNPAGCDDVTAGLYGAYGGCV